MVIIYGVVFLFLFALIYIVFNLVKRRGISCFLLPVCFFFGSYLQYWSPVFFRKDAMLLVLAAGCFSCYRNYLRKGNIRYLLGLYFVGCFAILTHEASFLFIFPFIAFHFLCKKTITGTVLISVFQTIIIGLPVLVCMTSVCYWHGNHEIAEAIWESWQPMLSEYPRYNDTNAIGEGLVWLTRSSVEVISKHTNEIWLSCPFHIPATLIMFIIIFLTYYLIVGINRIDAGFYKLKPINQSHISDILIIQFVSLIPLFIGLSSDLGRVIIYWALSALLIYGIFDEGELSCLPDRLHRFSLKATNYIGRAWLLRSNQFYFCVTLCLGISWVGVSFAQIVQSSVIGQLPLVAVKFCEYVLGYDIHIMD